ncbi:MAG: pyrroline-5-carboxylate reductase [Rhabdochlamydiaceae bacterium]|nr:pyrroline-5-carboxylate reductase [Rhabdochlamydiaceae bacterium]
MKIAVIGCGVMGGAFARHFAKKHPVILYDRSFEQTQNLAAECQGVVAESIEEAAKQADIILLGIKPKDLLGVAEALSEPLVKDKLVISMLAGVPLSALKTHFPHSKLLRVMPNLALTCGQGVVGMVDQGQLSKEIMRQIDELFDGMGLNAWMPESKLEALTALAASGIGFVFLMLEAMMEGGISMGFTSQESKDFVLKTMEGAVALVRETGKHPAELKLNISSPGGTTIAGLIEMENRGVRSGIINALLTAYHKAIAK